MNTPRHALQSCRIRLFPIAPDWLTNEPAASSLFEPEPAPEWLQELRLQLYSKETIVLKKLWRMNGGDPQITMF